MAGACPWWRTFLALLTQLPGRGVHPDGLVTVVSVQWFGSAALELHPVLKVLQSLQRQVEEVTRAARRIAVFSASNSISNGRIRSTATPLLDGDDCTERTARVERHRQPRLKHLST